MFDFFHFVSLLGSFLLSQARGLGFHPSVGLKNLSHLFEEGLSLHVFSCFAGSAIIAASAVLPNRTPEENLESNTLSA